jgi:exodeoxyribonuclease VII large subunit
MKQYSLYEVNEFIRRIVALNFQEPIWVRAEITGIGESRGHYYLDLIEKEKENTEIIARANAVIWRSTIKAWRTRPSLRLKELLQEGTEVLIKVQVDFHERWGFKLVIEDIDPAFTLGGLAEQKRKTLETLQKEELLELNGQKSLPLALQRIAVITSSRAAGWADFSEHLNQNPFGYHFQTTLFESSVQGTYAAEEILAALKKIKSLSQNFDCIAVIRGGGARLDLLAFDHLDLARTVARFPLPVLTGIGHDIDESILDQVAHTALKTPTAVADFLIHHNSQFEASLLYLAQAMEEQVSLIQKQYEHRLQQSQTRLMLASQHQIEETAARLSSQESQLKLALPYVLKNALSQLEELENQLRLLDPETLLKRGYTLSLINGKPLGPKAAKQIGQTLETHFQFGKLISEIKSGTTHEDDL